MPCNVLHVALAERGVVRTVNTLGPNILEAVQYRGYTLLQNEFTYRIKKTMFGLGQKNSLPKVENRTKIRQETSEILWCTFPSPGHCSTDED